MIFRDLPLKTLTTLLPPQISEVVKVTVPDLSKDRAVGYLHVAR